MSFVFIFECLLYYISLTVISLKIFDGVLNKKRLILSYSTYVILIVISFNVPIEILSDICLWFNIINIIFLKLCIKGIKLGSLIYSYIIIFSINAMITSALITFPSISSISNRLLIELSIHILMTIYCFISGFTSINKKIKGIILWTPRSVKFIMISIAPICTLVIALLLDVTKVVQNETTTKFTLCILIILAILIYATFPILIFNSISSAYFKNLNENYEKQIIAQAEHYSALSKSNFELRRFSHDFNNIRVGISKLIEEGKYSEAIKMLDSSNTEFYQTTHSLLMYDTGNGIVDALLADKQQKAASSNISIKFEGSVPQSSISSTELCVIFGNTVDNAIEACQKLAKESEKIINITCECNSGFMFLYISNPVNETVEIYNNTLPTTKADKTLHGFGLYSLDQIIQKHNGEIKYSCNYDLFELDISMCI